MAVKRNIQFGNKKGKKSSKGTDSGKKKKGGLKFQFNSEYEGPSRREMRHELRMEKEKNRGNPEIAKEREKTKRGYAYAGAATGASSAAAEAAKTQVINLSEGGINPSVVPPEPDPKPKDTDKVWSI